ncbi:hypothetical protein [Paraburkholderia tagetis]|uniref:Uncharacterized protein n=1 Tax=Paraburkholderia tagetis TaxID=2913261 RepID=A0A9X1UPY1_9BURK|nr:hypothetical protein [Paraburkholderia tagetis]MCG5079081.1 hypothetical protein [Paraburkholderia tagetis]
MNESGEDMAKSNEKRLDKCIEQAFQSNPEFTTWFLSRTGFANDAGVYRWSRSDNPWSTHPQETIDPATGEPVVKYVQSETDILVVFSRPNSGPFALHIENKLENGSFTSGQPERYKSRVTYWLNNPKYGAYVDFETVLIAPHVFFEKHRIDGEKFDRYVSHEDIAKYLPEFRTSGRGTDDDRVNFKIVAQTILRAGIWLIRHGYGRLMILPYAAPSGLYWRCAFHPPECFDEDVYRYTSGTKQMVLRGDPDIVMSSTMTPQALAELIAERAPRDVLALCEGKASQAALDWLQQFEKVLDEGYIPEAFNNDDDPAAERWALLGDDDSVGKMASQPGYRVPS